jgi:hypothetical protein
MWHTHVKGRLHPGLDDTLLAPGARPAKRAAQGPHHRAVGTASGWRSEKQGRA